MQRIAYNYAGIKPFLFHYFFGIPQIFFRYCRFIFCKNIPLMNTVFNDIFLCNFRIRPHISFRHSACSQYVFNITVLIQPYSMIYPFSIYLRNTVFRRGCSEDNSNIRLLFVIVIAVIIYMELEDKYINEFYDDKHADTFDYNKPFVYKFKYIYKDGTEYEWDTVFSCFDALCESIMEPEDDVISIQCTKMQIDRLNSRQIAYLTPSSNFLRIDPGCIDSDKERDLFWGVFDGLWFDFPTPFQKGDIVWDPKNPDGICAGPFVTTGVCLDEIQNDTVKDNLRRNGDSSDMCAGGFFLNEDGSIYGECMSNYMDLEFYDKELTDSKRTLIALSNFLKDEIDPALFARAYHQIITAGYAENSIPLDYLKSGMILAGLSKPEHIKIWLDDVR